MKQGKLLFTTLFLCILQAPIMAVAENSKEAEPAMAVEENSKEAESTMAVEENSKEAGPTMATLNPEPFIIKENVWPELVLRPIGVLSSAAGVGFFLGSLPFVAVASLLEPHNVFEITYEAFILTPFRFTFRRPIGDYSVPIDSE